MNLKFDNINVVCNSTKEMVFKVCGQDNPFSYNDEDIKILCIKIISYPKNQIHADELQIDFVTNDNKIVKYWNSVYETKEVVKLDKSYYEYIIDYVYYESIGDYDSIDTDENNYNYHNHSRLIKYIPYSKKINGINSLDIRLLCSENEIDEHINMLNENYRKEHPFLTFLGLSKKHEHNAELIKKDIFLFQKERTILNIFDEGKGFLYIDSLYGESQVVCHGGKYYTTVREADIDNPYFGILFNKENNKIEYIKFIPYK